MTRVRVVRSEDLSARDRRSLRSLFAQAWPLPDDAFTEDDWDHTLGGTHFLVQDDRGRVRSHAAVVPRELHVGGRALATGYVEGVATLGAYRRRGLGSAVMRAAGEHIDAAFELGALGTGEHAFYERLGWVRWRGETAVRTGQREVRTPEEDGFVMVRLTPRSPALDLGARISCDWRPGDVW